MSEPAKSFLMIRRVSNGWLIEPKGLMSPAHTKVDAWPPHSKEDSWWCQCGEPVAGKLAACPKCGPVTPAPLDPTADTEPLTTGQQIVRGFEADLIAEPCELAEAAEVTSPVRKWRCFHCDEVFTDRACAAVHFGDDDGATPACRVAADLVGLVEMIRKQESELDAFRREETASYREFYALGAAHHQAVRRAEEAGYAKALADIEAGKLEPEHAGRIVDALAPLLEGMR